jgi:hypothetical protein
MWPRIGNHLVWYTVDLERRAARVVFVQQVTAGQDLSKVG